MLGNVLSDGAGPNVKAAYQSEAYDNPDGLAFVKMLLLSLDRGTQSEVDRQTDAEKKNHSRGAPRACPWGGILSKSPRPRPGLESKDQLMLFHNDSNVYLRRSENSGSLRLLLSFRTNRSPCLLETENVAVISREPVNHLGLLLGHI